MSYEDNAVLKIAHHNMLRSRRFEKRGYFLVFDPQKNANFILNNWLSLGILYFRQSKKCAFFVKRADNQNNIVSKIEANLFECVTFFK